jgi:hypothetical protein
LAAYCRASIFNVVGIDIYYQLDVVADFTVMPSIDASVTSTVEDSSNGNLPHRPSWRINNEPAKIKGRGG